MKRVLFACIHNAGRSQMAAAWFNHIADPGHARAISAGTAPAPKVHPEVAQAMGEVGIELRDAKPTLLTPDMTASVDLLVTMGCGESCPYVPGLRRLDWQVPDPKGQPVERVRQIRDTLREQIQELVMAEGWQR